jgi:hypothetical protein
MPIHADSRVTWGGVSSRWRQPAARQFYFTLKRGASKLATEWPMLSTISDWGHGCLTVSGSTFYTVGF